MNAFLEAVEQARNPAPSAPGTPRLVFALDATASRQPTWDMAGHLTAKMFSAVARIGGLDVQLVYFRGHTPPAAGPWVSDARRLTKAMSGIRCLSGLTQIGKVLDHISRENQRQKVNAFIYIGDTSEEDDEDLIRKAAALGVKMFVFHENPIANLSAVAMFKAIAAKSGGVYFPFDANSAQKVGELLAGIAAFAAGGKDALLARNDAAARLLLGHLK